MEMTTVTKLEDPLQLTDCDTQQLEFIGAIQDTGSVVVVRNGSMEVLAYSANIGDEGWASRAPEIGTLTHSHPCTVPLTHGAFRGGSAEHSGRSFLCR